jgi:hypothetical protein
MGSLYDMGTDPAPAASGVLCKLTLSCSGTVNVTVAENTTRGGIVMENTAVSADATLKGCAVSCAPSCWACPCQPYGDANCDGFLSALDVQIMAAAWSGAYDPCADFNHDGFITALDVQILAGYWATGCP